MKEVLVVVLGALIFYRLYVKYKRIKGYFEKVERK